MLEILEALGAEPQVTLAKIRGDDQTRILTDADFEEAASQVIDAAMPELLKRITDSLQVVGREHESQVKVAQDRLTELLTAPKSKKEPK